MSDLDRWSKFCCSVALLIVVVLIGNGIADAVFSAVEVMRLAGHP
jgi:hypothetical protein